MNDKPMDFGQLLGKGFLKSSSQPREFIHFTGSNVLWHNYENQPAKKCLYALDRDYFSICWGVGAVFDCYPNADMTKFTEHSANGDQYEWVHWKDEQLSDQSSSFGY